VKEILQKLDAHAKSNANLMPTILEAAESYATLGEIADTMRNVFGEHV
jgi:methylmalonyl-CoA mutase, N-terminal domain